MCKRCQCLMSTYFWSNSIRQKDIQYSLLNVSYQELISAVTAHCITIFCEINAMHVHTSHCKFTAQKAIMCDPKVVPV